MEYAGPLRVKKTVKDLIELWLYWRMLQQINAKKYETELIASGVKTVYKYGVAFSGKKVEVTTS